MKKLNLVMALALPLAIMSNIDNAAAQRANHTKKDVGTAISEKYDNATESAKEIHKDAKHKASHKTEKMNKKHGFEEKLNHENQEINEDYEKAVKKINKSSFNDAQKKMLMNQAEENKKLAMDQAKARMELMKKHMNQRMENESFKSAMHTDKANKKAVKEVREILD